MTTAEITINKAEQHLRDMASQPMFSKSDANIEKSKSVDYVSFSDNKEKYVSIDPKKEESCGELYDVVKEIKVNIMNWYGVLPPPSSPIRNDYIKAVLG